MLTRRRFVQEALQLSAAISLGSDAAHSFAAQRDGVEVNDVQSQLNATRVERIVKPTSLDDLQSILHDARRKDRAVSIAGGRHSMGGQQFGEGTVLIDIRSLNHVVNFDRERGQIEVEGGIEWPELIDYLHVEQASDKRAWAIREKQTGVDRVSISGSLSSNVHGRGLRFPPFISDIESFMLVDGSGEPRKCSRNENAELFSLAIGGYGLFGVVVQVTLRLVPRTKVERLVEVIPVKDLLPWVDKRLDEGCAYGDCQYSTDLTSTPESHQGVFACYKAIDVETPIDRNQKELSADDWQDLYRLARTDKKKAFERYSQYYLSTAGQIYWSDEHQLASNFDQYRQAVKKGKGTEVITEVYLHRDEFLSFLSEVRKDFLENAVDMTYGTIRFIEKDNESFLPWARDRMVCILCNLHVNHTEAGKEKAAADFRRIIDRAIEHGGNYYLTYHRWATRKQVEACYPQFVEFLRLKKKYDPNERFQSDWYRHYRRMFSDRL